MEFRIEDSIAHVTLNRPEVGNAINAALVNEIVRIARICDSDKSVRVVLLTANGKMFCVGGDLTLFSSMGDQAEVQLKELADQLHKAISIFARMDAPLVIAVNGMAAGGGFSLCLTGDYVVAAESAKFTMAYTSAGLSPDGSSTYFLPRLVGIRKAQELMLLNRTLSAQEAAQWGLIALAVPDEKLNDEALAVCRSLVQGPRHAQSAVKRLLFCSLQNGLEEQMELEGHEISRAAASPEGREGIAAFIEKRRPRF
ncbi:enoyl-CoA hydratase/isomerase family protein [Bradyrhizobium icense]|uniref:enoyl-CoA hydratase/isomerase family protein n=1 Tax=Bradyrhizobium icense TaxID=1274631 RepID=UPI001AED0B68|nr:enoyl-CoA hydratase-related protein [Bradyrhizobium icense]